MAVKVAINGSGRIGRLVLRAAMESGRKDIDFVAINDLGSVEANAHLLRYDTMHGVFPSKVKVMKTGIDCGRGVIKVFTEDPANLPWDKLDIDVVMECTEFFLPKESKCNLIDAGAKKVLTSAPATGEDITVVYGNDKKLKKSHKVVSNASCTTNCLAPVAAVLNKAIGIQQDIWITRSMPIRAIKAYKTPCIVIFGAPGAASYSMIPTGTGAASEWSVLPELNGKLDDHDQGANSKCVHR